MQKRKIQIDNRGTFEVYGNKPWFLVPVESPKGGWSVGSEDTAFDEKFLNCLIKITETGAKIPVVFTGKGIEIGQEIVDIINAKL